MNLPVRKTLKGRRAVVIGATAAGLAAAIALAVRGARVVVLEATDLPGAGLRAVRRGGFRFDPWPPVLTSPRVLSALFAGAGHRLTDFLTLQRVDPFLRFVLSGGETLDWGTDGDAFADRVADGDARARKAWQALLARGHAMDRAAASWEQAPRRTDVGMAGLAWMLRSLPSLLDPRTDGQLLQGRLPATAARRAVLSLRSIFGVSPWKARGGFLRHLAHWQEEGAWTTEGGGEALHHALLRLAELLSVRIVPCATVERIDLQNGRVRGVSGSGFKPLQASVVVSALRPMQTLERFLPQDVVSVAKALRRRVRLPRSNSRFALLLGATKQWDVLRPVTVFVGESPREEARALDSWRLPAVGGTVVVSAGTGDAAPAGATALAVREEVPEPGPRFRWNDEKADEEADRLVRLLEKRGLKGLGEAADLREVAPPHGSVGADLAAWGHEPGFVQESLWSMLRTPGPRWGEVPGLYFASGWVRPGPGLERMLLGGMLAAVCAADDAD